MGGTRKVAESVSLFNLGNTSMLEPSSSLLFGSMCEASYLLHKDTREGGVITEERRLLSWAGTCLHCPLSVKSLCSVRQTEDRESSILWVMSACLACPRKGRVCIQWYISLHLWYSSTYSSPHKALSLRAPFIYVGGLGHRCSWPCPGLSNCCHVFLVPLAQENLLCTELEHSSADHVSTRGTCLSNLQSLKSFGKLKYLFMMKPEF